MAKRAGGRSFYNGIMFSTENYSITFKSKDKERINVRLKKIGGETQKKILDKMRNYPILRSITTICRNMGWILLILGVIFILEMLIKKMGGKSLYDFNVLNEHGEELRNKIMNASINEKILYAAIITIFFLIIQHPVHKILLSILAERDMVAIDINHNNLWKYHGAEHKIIVNYLSGLENTYENCVVANRVADNCGTMLAVIYIIICSIDFLVFKIFPITAFYSIRMFVVLLISIELFWVDRNNKFLKPIFKLGYLAQEKLFTKEPDEYQLKQGIKAFEILIKAEEGKLSEKELNELLSEEGKEFTII